MHVPGELGLGTGSSCSRGCFLPFVPSQTSEPPSQREPIFLPPFFDLTCLPEYFGCDQILPRLGSLKATRCGRPHLLFRRGPGIATLPSDLSVGALLVQEASGVLLWEGEVPWASSRGSFCFPSWER